MSTFHEDGVAAAVAEILEDPQAISVYAECLRKMNAGFFKRVEFVSQEWERKKRFTIGDAYCFAEINNAIWTGKIGMADVIVGMEPLPDRHMAEMEVALKRLFDVPSQPRFDVSLWGEKADCDGSLVWDAPLGLGWLTDPGDGTEIDTRRTIPAGSAPIEIGYTRASRTLMHLQESRCLARWPYGSEFIRLFVVLDPSWRSIQVPYFERGETPQPRRGR